MYIHMCVYIYTFICTYIYTYIYIYIHACGYNKSTCCRLCLHWWHPCCEKQHIDKQSRETHRISIQYQQGKTAKMTCERMKLVLRDRVQECTYAGVQVECRYARMHCREFAAFASFAHSDLIIPLPIFLVLALFDKHATQTTWGGSGWIRGNAYTESDVQINQSKEKRGDCSINDLGGKRREFTRARGMGWKWRRRGNSHSCSTTSGWTAGCSNKVVDRESKRIPTYET